METTPSILTWRILGTGGFDRQRIRDTSETTQHTLRVTMATEKASSGFFTEKLRPNAKLGKTLSFPVQRTENWY